MQESSASGWDTVPGVSVHKQSAGETIPFRQDNLPQLAALLESDPGHFTLGFAQLVEIAASVQIVTLSPAMLKLIDTVEQVRNIPVPLLITGETGTGKGLIARAVHARSTRQGQEFIIFDCAAAGSGTIESELFGHLSGSFTGATSNRKGLIREAEGGTIFLDEISELPSEMQGKLLHVLQEREVRPMGKDAYVKIDVRVIAATNRDLDVEVRAGRFRDDLYARLKVLRLQIPPLRERPEDIPLLTAYFLWFYQREWGKQGVRLSDEAKELMRRYGWPYNVREVENEVRQLVALARDNEVIGPERLSPEIRAGARPPSTPMAAIAGGNIVIPLSLSYREMKDELERLAILNALKNTGGNKLKAAALMKMSRDGFDKAIRRLRIKVEKNYRHKSCE